MITGPDRQHVSPDSTSIGVNRRVLRWSAITAAAGLLVGFGMLGDSPDTRDSSAQIAKYFVDHSTSVLAGVVMLSIGACALLVFGSSLAQHFDTTGEGVAGRVAQSASTIVAALIVTTMAVAYAALAYVVGAEASDSAKGIFEVTLVATPVVAAPSSLLCATTAWVTLRRAGRRWFGWVSAAVAIVLAVGAMSFATKGMFSPDVQQQVVFEVFIAWLVTAGIALGRRHPINANDRQPARAGSHLRRHVEGDADVNASG